jgi:NAD(P)-dependent dehydrogenase (short-subunit alcohol dehydrogenase family)
MPAISQDYIHNDEHILDRFQLDGRVALVTGGGQGIGRAFCHALGEAGARVIVVDKDHHSAERVTSELIAKKIAASACIADVSDKESIEAMIAHVVSVAGKLDIAVNNAGINYNSAAEETSLEEWDRTFALNLRGLFLCCQAESRVMLKAGYGKIINTASASSLIVPHPQKQATYNTTKAAVAHLTRSLAAEWADRGVRVNAISPGFVKTALLEQPALKPLVEKWIPQIPVGRMADVTELQGAIVYLASGASDYMTGHNLVIDGGLTLW